MRITFLLGNGFDLNLGLKTRYQDFYKYYLNQPSKSLSVIAFKGQLSKNLENWSDLEIELGKYAKNFNKDNEENFIDLLYDIQDNLAEYLDQQDRQFDVSNSDKEKALDDLINFEKYLTQRDRKVFSNYNNFGNNNISVFTFNYTKTFEKIYNWNGAQITIDNRRINGSSYYDRINLFEHIHGTTMNNMILGVNDPSQILSDDLKDSIKTLRSFIKTEMNYNTGTLRDERCVESIEKSDIICIYGMSLGDTDKYWWRKIGDRMANSSTVLVIFAKKDEIIPNRRGYAQAGNKDLIKNIFLSHLEFDDTLKSKISKRILVCLNSEMFKVNLDYAMQQPNAKDAFISAEKLLEKELNDLKKSLDK